MNDAVKRTIIASLIGTSVLAPLSFKAMADRSGIEIGGDLQMIYEAKNSPQTAVAVGPLTKASAEANVIEGDVHIGGSVKLQYNAENSPQTATAVGPGAEARASANRVSGK